MPSLIILIICTYCSHLTALQQRQQHDEINVINNYPLVRSLPGKQLNNKHNISTQINVYPIRHLIMNGQQITELIARKHNSSVYYHNQHDKQQQNKQKILNTHLIHKSLSPQQNISRQLLSLMHQKQQQQQFPPYRRNSLLQQDFSTGIQSITARSSHNLQSLPPHENIANQQIYQHQEPLISNVIHQKKSDELFPLWNTYQLIDSPSSKAERRLKKCCSRLNEADPECKKHFCGFDALEPQTVSIF